MILKPPATPSPGIGGAPKTSDLRVLDFLAPLPAQSGHDGRVAQLRACGASSNGSSMMNIEAKFELFACSTNDMPGDGHRVGHPGVFAGDLVDLRHDLLRALQRGRVGQLHADDEPALILLRDEARRAPAEDASRSGPAGRVDQQHDHDRAAASLPTIQA